MEELAVHNNTQQTHVWFHFVQQTQALGHLLFMYANIMRFFLLARFRFQCLAAAQQQQ